MAKDIVTPEKKHFQSIEASNMIIESEKSDKLQATKKSKPNSGLISFLNEQQVDLIPDNYYL